MNHSSPSSDVARPKHFILVSAAPFETKELADGLSARGFSCSQVSCGIGALNAAKASIELLNSCRDQDVLFVGTCGSFSGFTGVRLVTPRRILWLPAGERCGLAYTVQGSAPPITPPPRPKWAANLSETTVVCSPTISLDGRLPTSYLGEEVVENLELYSCAAELSAAAASLTIMLGITNGVGPKAHAQWRAHFAEAATCTRDWVLAALDAVAF